MKRHVKGVLFADYVRMVRAHKAVAWGAHLRPADLELLKARIEDDAWYPMEVFERLGNAILREIAGGNLEGVRVWGRMSVEKLRATWPELVAPGDPVETLRRFRVLRSTFFDFEALELATLVDDHADIVVHYHMGPVAEEAASFQAMGFFERLLELSGATAIEHRFAERSWADDRRTLLVLTWRPPTSL